MNRKYRLVFLAGGALAIEAATAAAEGVAAFSNHKPIEAYVAPATLFRHDHGSNLARIYRPQAAYDRPGGKRVGQVTLANPQCAAPDIDSASGQYRQQCSEGLVYRFVDQNGKRFEVEIGEYGYEEPGLVTRSPVKRIGTRSWGQIAYAGGTFWVTVKSSDVHDYEAKSYLIGDFDTWCANPAACAPVSAAMRADIERLVPPPGTASSSQRVVWLDSCFEAVYQISGRKTINGRRYYIVLRANLLEGAPKVDLPETGLIPTRNRDGSHSGYFFSRGC